MVFIVKTEIPNQKNFSNSWISESEIFQILSIEIAHMLE